VDLTVQFLHQISDGKKKNQLAVERTQNLVPIVSQDKNLLAIGKVLKIGSRRFP